MPRGKPSQNPAPLLGYIHAAFVRIILSAQSHFETGRVPIPVVEFLLQSAHPDGFKQAKAILDNELIARGFVLRTDGVVWAAEKGTTALAIPQRAVSVQPRPVTEAQVANVCGWYKSGVRTFQRTHLDAPATEAGANDPMPSDADASSAPATAQSLPPHAVRIYHTLQLLMRRGGWSSMRVELASFVASFVCDGRTAGEALLRKLLDEGYIAKAQKRISFTDKKAEGTDTGPRLTDLQVDRLIGWHRTGLESFGRYNLENNPPNHKPTGSAEALFGALGDASEPEGSKKKLTTSQPSILLIDAFSLRILADMRVAFEVLERKHMSRRELRELFLRYRNDKKREWIELWIRQMTVDTPPLLTFSHGNEGGKMQIRFEREAVPTSSKVEVEGWEKIPPLTPEEARNIYGARLPKPLVAAQAPSAERVGTLHATSVEAEEPADAALEAATDTFLARVAEETGIEPEVRVRPGSEAELVLRVEEFDDLLDDDEEEPATAPVGTLPGTSVEPAATANLPETTEPMPTTPSIPPRHDPKSTSTRTVEAHIARFLEDVWSAECHLKRALNRPEFYTLLLRVPIGSKTPLSVRASRFVRAGFVGQEKAPDPENDTFPFLYRGAFEVVPTKGGRTDWKSVPPVTAENFEEILGLKKAAGAQPPTSASVGTQHAASVESAAPKHTPPPPPPLIAKGAIDELKVRMLADLVRAHHALMKHGGNGRMSDLILDVIGRYFPEDEPEEKLRKARAARIKFASHGYLQGHQPKSIYGQWSLTAKAHGRHETFSHYSVSAAQMAVQPIGEDELLVLIKKHHSSLFPDEPEEQETSAAPVASKPAPPPASAPVGTLHATSVEAAPVAAVEAPPPPPAEGRPEPVEEHPAPAQSDEHAAHLAVIEQMISELTAQIAPLEEKLTPLLKQRDALQAGLNALKSK